MRIHSRADTCSGARSAMRPTRSMQFSCTRSCRFLRIGVRRGSSSLIGGVMRCMPITLTIALRPARIEPSTSGYSSPRNSYSTVPRWPISCSSSHSCMTTATRAIRSAACCRFCASRFLSCHLIVPATCGRYGLTRAPSAPSTVPNAASIALASSLACSWNAYSRPSTSAFSRRASTSAAPIAPTTASTHSSAITRNGSDSSLSAGARRASTSAAPHFSASSSVVSVSALALRRSSAMRRTQKWRKKSGTMSLRT
mmetsp:Transcript_12420/g.30490  ORF Transcript_12420/g.30490 Transcript_12420/m.30490 type:complete len:255 (+) Transcript_12420:721-1485(+)